MEKRTQTPKIKVIDSAILHIQKHYGTIKTITKSDIALTNEVFFIQTEKHSLVLKVLDQLNPSLLYYKDHHELIDYLHAFSFTPRCFFFSDQYAILEFVNSSYLKIEKLNDCDIESLAKIVKTIHLAPFKTAIRNFEKTAQEYIKEIPLEYLKHPTLSFMTENSYRLFEVLSGFDQDLCLCHNDLNYYNFLKTPKGIMVLDFDYSSINDRYFDLASISNIIGEDQFNSFLKYYDTDFNPKKLLIYKMLISYLSCLWCFMMLKSTKKDDFDYLNEAETYAQFFIKNIDLL